LLAAGLVKKRPCQLDKLHAISGGLKSPIADDYAPAISREDINRVARFLDLLHRLPFTFHFHRWRSAAAPSCDEPCVKSRRAAEAIVRLLIEPNDKECFHSNCAMLRYDK
jgi:hypothetical protein